MSKLGKKLHEEGLVLRSGGADGCDQAFEKHVPVDSKQIFKPWGKSDAEKGEIVIDGPVKLEATRIVSAIHPAWNNCTGYAKSLLTRNVYQSLGPDLKTYSWFMVYYSEEDKEGRIYGGTATAVKIANQYNIPAYNLYHLKNKRMAEKIIKEGIKK